MDGFMFPYMRPTNLWMPIRSIMSRLLNKPQFQRGRALASFPLRQC